MKTFAFRCGGAAQDAYFVLLHTAEPPAPPTWEQHVQALIERLAQSEAPVHIFAATDGGGPNPAQRRALAKAFATDRHGAMTHVFTTNAFTRGIVTAFHWVARSRAVAHHPDAFPLVCKQCRAPGRAVLNDLFVLQRKLPPVTLLAQLARTARSGATHVT